MGMRVVVEIVAHGAARNMDVGQPIERQPSQGGHRVPASVARVRVHVRDVEEQAGIRSPEQLSQERCLVHLRPGPLHQRGDVLECQREWEQPPGPGHVVNNDLKRLAGPWDGEQVSRLQAISPNKCEMLADEPGAQSLGYTSKMVEPSRVRALRTPKRKTETMHDDGDTPCHHPRQRRRDIVELDILRCYLDKAERLTPLDGECEFRPPADSKTEARHHAHPLHPPQPPHPPQAPQPFLLGLSARPTSSSGPPSRTAGP